jgi:predicted RNA-binding protein with PUA-like domain
MNHWLFKTEPGDFSIDDLARASGKKTHWNGVRNYQARNLLRDDVHRGDPVLLYHSSSVPSGIVGICEVVSEAYADDSALDPASQYYDPKATATDPRWFMVDIRLKERFPRMLTLEELRMVKVLLDMELLRRGSRLSIQPVTTRQFNAIVAMTKK